MPRYTATYYKAAKPPSGRFDRAHAALLPNYDLWHSASIPVFLHHRIAFEDTRRRQKKMLSSKNKTETGSNYPIELSGESNPCFFSEGHVKI